MQPSRDDFVIAIRSAFLKKGNKQRFSLLGLLFFSLILITLGKYNFKGIDYLKISLNELIYRGSFIVSVPEKYIKYSFNSIIDHFKLYSQHEATKEELKKLKSKNYNINFLTSENDRLKKILQDTRYSSEEQVAKVLIDKKSPFLRSIIINKGSKNNIEKGMAILNDDYLVGKVVEVNFSTSRVLLLTDLNSKIPVIIEPDSIQSILTGTGEDIGIIQYSIENKKFTDGSTVYTSGMGGLFKAGIPIGKIY
ncbi:rod shape-determining protein MreC, partial [Candidatus Pelagibacter sp.]|nr:rod shape-determining protein MreC [Candidatus Pelagibacter sp.]